MTRKCSGVGGRGCPCEWHAKRRIYARNFVRRRYAAKLSATRMTHRTCPRRFGRFGVCGAVLISETLNGALVVRCPACERFARGICRDCNAPVDGAVRKARRCAACKVKASRAAFAKYRANNRDELNRRGRKSYRTDAEVRRRRNEYKRLWRKANPEKVRAQKQREAARENERRNAYHAEYRRKHRRRIAKAQRDRNHGVQKLRRCVSCRRVVVTHRKRMCSKCKELARSTALAALSPRRRSRAA